MPKTYLGHYLPETLREFDRMQAEFDSNRKPEDPAGKFLITVKPLERAREQIALLGMADDLSVRLERAEGRVKELEDHVISLMSELQKLRNGTFFT